jgi:hypothetical protein
MLLRTHRWRRLWLEFVLSRCYKYVAPTALAAAKSHVVLCQRFICYVSSILHSGLMDFVFR